MDSQKTESQRDKLNRLFKEYGLLTEDVHKHQHYTIIRRTGIEKIAAAVGIKITYEACATQPDYAAVKAIAKKPVGAKFLTVETFGSACKDTSQNKYYLEMAEKRAMSRAVLKLSDLYALGAYGEDEADDFSRARNPEPAAETARPTVAAPAPAAEPEASAPASAPQAVPATADQSSAPAERATEAQLQQLVQLIASQDLDKEERDMLLSMPVDQRPAAWVENTLAKLPAVLAERKDPKTALAAAQKQLRTAAAKHQKDMPDAAYKALILRAGSVTAKPAELRAEARAVLAQFQLVAA